MFSSLLRLHEIKLISLRHAQAEEHLLGNRHGGRIAEALELENGHGSLVGVTGHQLNYSCREHLNLALFLDSRFWRCDRTRPPNTNQIR